MRPAAAFALAAALFVVAPRGVGQDITDFGDKYVLQFDEASGEKLEDFINLAQKLLGRPIRYEPGDVSNQQIRIIGPQSVKKERFYQYFQAVLKAYDFLIIEYGPKDANFLSVQKITPGRTQGGAGGTIKSQAPVVNVEDLDKFQDDPATLITTSIPLHYVNARDQINTVQPMFDTTIEIVRPVDNANQLVITGFGSHVWGAWQLIKLIDVPPFKPTPIIHQRVLLHAAVDEIQDVVNDLLNAARGLRTGQVQQAAQAQGATIFEIEPRVIPEPRSNSLLITGDEEMVARIEEWVDVLDIEVEPRGNTHVYRLKNTNAKEVEEVLTRVLDQERLNGQNRPGGGAGAAAAAQGQGLEVASSAVADIASNSVIITASERKYREIVSILREMDVRRPQVLIEAAIVETSKVLTDALTAGIAAVNIDHGGLISNYGTPTGLNDAGAVDLLGSLIPPPAGGTIGLFSGGDIPIPIIVEALQTDVGNRVLSRPYLMTNDNQEATISTNEQTSYATSTTTQTSTQNGFTPVEAGITLTISPSISAGNYLRLKVQIEVSNFTSPPANVPGAPPDKTIRKVTTPVTLPDGHTAILGGLVNNTATDSMSKVPWLGDIPLLGWLFRSSTDLTKERYLYVFITPHIIDTDFALLDELSEGRKRDLERLGGDIRELTAELPEASDADRRVFGAGLDSVFEMPSAAFPSSGEHAAPPPAPGTVPSPAPGYEDVFGYDKDKDGKPKP